MTGLWPVNIQKPMNNRLRRSATLRAVDEALAAEEASRPPEPELGRIETPKTGRQLKDLGVAYLGKDVVGGDSTRQLLWAKFGKSIDDLTSRIGRLEYEKAGLEADLEKTRAQKRRKVDEDPNEGFVSLADIRQVQADVREGRPRKRPKKKAAEGPAVDQNRADIIGAQCLY
ncbi:Jerky protein-like protein [Apiospora hydei]|uniref:Jerky protein-like protein n=1 Tax=Apiospora hydei TaxID=1337664 RepID=A0ABR1WWW0_9PEZI